MEVRPGYKQTEVGVIPEDWSVTTVGEISEVKTGPFGTALHEKDYVDDGTPIITVEHLGESGVTYQNLPLVSDADRLRLSAYWLRRGDIVFSRVGSVDRNALITPTEHGWLFSGRLLRVRPALRQVHPPYLSHHFHSEAFRQRVREVSVGQTMASINTEILSGVEAVLPPTKAEQEAIAKALNDADALIEVLEHLLAKKRQLKQGAMEELLTGKKRLPGFESKPGHKQTEIGLLPADWDSVRFSDLLEFRNGVNADKAAYGAGVRFINVLEVITKSHLLASDIPGRIALPKQAIDWYLVRRGDLVFNRTSETQEEVGLAAVYADDEPVVFGGFVIRGRQTRDADLDAQYSGYALRSPYIRRQIITRGQGAIRANVGQNDLRSVHMPRPPRPEQEAIATCLSNVDTDIAALEAKLAKVRQLKQGMMQELLTGRIRLPVDERTATEQT